MAPRTVKLLHVEDDHASQLLIAHHLKAVEEFTFAITYAESEEQAVEELGKGDYQFVILDYELADGDGLSCLHRLRRLNSFLPVVVISGAATPEITGELLRFGADDNFSKNELTSSALAQSVRNLLKRSREATDGTPKQPVAGTVTN